jgi:hypothetical protein
MLAFDWLLVLVLALLGTIVGFLGGAFLVGRAGMDTFNSYIEGVRKRQHIVEANAK